MLSFLKNHVDTLAIIGVIIGAAAILFSMHLSFCHKIDSTNARIDATYLMIYDVLKEKRK